MKHLLLTVALTCTVSCGSLWAQEISERGFRHPGGLHTQADFDRVKQQLADGNERVTQAYNLLKKAEYSQAGVTSYPVETIVRGGGTGENYINAARGATMAYQNALRWKIDGTEANAKTAVKILMAWANTTTGISGDSNYALAAGLYGYQFAQAAELMRDYEGWSAADFKTFQNWMLHVWYPSCIGFLRTRNGTWENSSKWWQAPGHYWSNWGLCNALAVISIGVLCDDVFIYNQGMSFIKYDQVGTFKEVRTDDPIKNDGLTEFWGNLIVTTSESDLETGAYGMLGQMQESGRDIGHAGMAAGLAVDVAHQGWNQGDDLFSYMNHRLAAGIEYIAAQTQSVEGLPWTNYIYGTNGYYYTDSRCWVMTGPVLGAQIRPMWGTVIGHYEGVKGVKMPFSEQAYTTMGIDAGGTGSTSGSYDQLGYSVLMNTYGDSLGYLNPTPPTELTGKMTYRKVTYDMNHAGGTTNTYSTVAVSLRGIAAGTEVTMTPEIADGSLDTGNWLWDTGETTRELTVTANESHLYRVTYTNADGVKSEQAFSIAVKGDCYASKLTPSITYNGTTRSNVKAATVVKGSSVTLALSAPDGYGNYRWSTGATDASITLTVEKDTTIEGKFTNQGGRASSVTFTLLTTDEALEADNSRKVELGNYYIRHRYTGNYLVNRGDSAVLSAMPITENIKPDYMWYIYHTTAATYDLISLQDSMAMTNTGTMKARTFKPHRIVYAKDCNYCAFYNSSKQYWVVDADNNILYGTTTTLNDFEWELIPVPGSFEPSGIESISSSVPATDESIYDVSGSKLTAIPERGIYIKGGKKYNAK